MASPALRAQGWVTPLHQFALIAGFFLTGVVTVLLGPILPVLASKWHSQDTQLGYFFVAQFAGSTVGALLSERLARACGIRAVLTSGFLLIATAVWVLSTASPSIGVTAVLAYGFGLGVVIPAINILFADIHRTAPESALNLLNSVWTIGAVACPLMVSLALRKADIASALHLIAIVSVACAIAVATLRMPYTPAARTSNTDRTDAARNRALWWTVALLFFLYVGLENTIAGWAATYAQQTGVTHTFASAALVPAIFWAALLIGRSAFAALMVRHVRPMTVSNVAAGLVVLGWMVLFATPRPEFVFTGLIVAGIGFAPIFPNAIATAKSLLRDRNITPLFACAGAGGAVVPYLVGVASSGRLHLSTGLRFAFVLACALAFVQWRISQHRSVAVKSLARP